MSKIRIKNFGPIKEGFDSDDGFMDIKKVTVFIGDQGSGKSTVAKLISILTWMEKARNRGERIMQNINFDRFIQLCNYQGISNYIMSGTEVEYIGNAFSIKINGDNVPDIRPVSEGKYIVPKIMYVPAERNFLSTIRAAYDVTGLPASLVTFAEELKRANVELSGSKIDMPIRDYVYEYDEFHETSYISGAGYKINLLEASSGLQSLIPLYLVSRNLALSIADADDHNDINISINQRIRRNEEITRITLDREISEEEKKERVNRINESFHNKCFVNVVEEPEQNLFPTSQRHILNSLLEYASMNNGNKLIMTTHSPYLINYLSIAIQGKELLEKLSIAKQDDLRSRLDEIVPVNSCVDGSDVVVYQLQDNGSINRLPAYEGIPSDKNYLNQSLAEGNQLFDSLLEIEQAI